LRKFSYKQKKTTQPQTNNARNEHDRKRQINSFVSKCSVCNFSTFGTKCVNHINHYELENNKKPQQVKQDTLHVFKTIHAK
jgi:hypothetical protein